MVGQSRISHGSTSHDLGRAAEGDMHHLFRIQAFANRLARRSEFWDLAFR